MRKTQRMPSRTSRVAPGAALAVRSAGSNGDQRLQDLPLLVGKVHPSPPSNRSKARPLYRL